MNARMLSADDDEHVCRREIIGLIFEAKSTGVSYLALSIEEEGPVMT